MYIKNHRHLQISLRWASEVACRSIDRATRPAKQEGMFTLDILALCCKLSEGRLYLMEKRSEMNRICERANGMPLTGYRQAVRSLRKELGPELKSAFGNARLIAIRTGHQRALTAIDEILVMRWEDPQPPFLISRLSSGIGRPQL